MPEDLGQMQGLRVLTIDTAPKLSTLPASLTLLTSLQHLMVSDCEIFSSLPEEGFGNLASLLSLTLNDLPLLLKLPAAVSLLASLQVLLLAGDLRPRGVDGGAVAYGAHQEEPKGRLGAQHRADAHDGPPRAGSTTGRCSATMDLARLRKYFCPVTSSASDARIRARAQVTDARRGSRGGWTAEGKMQGALGGEEGRGEGE
ncbi:unnamed protein product [Closterium sp. Naga37s-1]|nr:unnamed protein product [Closterium sp. Naga37s-1]